MLGYLLHELIWLLLCWGLFLRLRVFVSFRCLLLVNILEVMGPIRNTMSCLFLLMLLHKSPISCLHPHLSGQELLVQLLLKLNRQLVILELPTLCGGRLLLARTLIGVVGVALHCVSLLI